MHTYVEIIKSTKSAFICGSHYDIQTIEFILINHN